MTRRTQSNISSVGGGMRSVLGVTSPRTQAPKPSGPVTLTASSPGCVPVGRARGGEGRMSGVEIARRILTSCGTPSVQFKPAVLCSSTVLPCRSCSANQTSTECALRPTNWRGYHALYKKGGGGYCSRGLAGQEEMVDLAGTAGETHFHWMTVGPLSFCSQVLLLPLWHPSHAGKPLEGACLFELCSALVCCTCGGVVAHVALHCSNTRGPLPAHDVTVTMPSPLTS